MARVFLINPSMDTAAGFGEYRALSEAMPPTGLAYVAGAARRAGHTVGMIDNFVENRPDDKLAATVQAFAPDVVGIPVLTPVAQGIERFCARLRETNPNVKVVMGNHHASVFAEELVDRGVCDVVVHGEGEERFPQVVDALVGDSGLESVPGVTWRPNGHVETTGRPPQIRELDTLARPAWDMLPWAHYTFLPFVTVARPCLAVVGSRGCPYRCSYCVEGGAANGLRVRSPEAIADEMEWLVRDMGVRHAGFVDPIFPFNKKHGLAVCNAIAAREIPGDWWWTSETRIDVIDDEMAHAMKASRCKRVLFGIESGVEDSMRRVNKKYNREAIRRGVAATRSAGLEITGFFMIGLPGETAEKTREAIDFACSLDIDFAKFAILVPFPGTQLYDSLVADGQIRKSDWVKFATFSADPETLPFIPEGLTGAELQRLQKRATFRFYVRPRMIWRHLFVTRSIGLRNLYHGARILLTQWLRGKV
ncbi:MAG: cobalamin B12-binding domain-containing protein [Deltaproteobacteria bacterium]|nr:cobalamin B12-binding domain-containing protein [Deltaproteobacteria bacterium]